MIQKIERLFMLGDHGLDEFPEGRIVPASLRQKRGALLPGLSLESLAEELPELLDPLGQQCLFRFHPLTLYFLLEPCFYKAPIPDDRSLGNSMYLGDLLEGQPDEEAQIHDSAHPPERLVPLQFVQGLLQGLQVIESQFRGGLPLLRFAQLV